MVNGQSVAITGTQVNVTLTNGNGGLKSEPNSLLYSIPTLGLSNPWHFDENAGIVVTDAAGTNNDSLHSLNKV